MLLDCLRVFEEMSVDSFALLQCLAGVAVCLPQTQSWRVRHLQISPPPRPVLPFLLLMMFFVEDSCAIDEFLFNVMYEEALPNRLKKKNLLLKFLFLFLNSF